MPTVRANGIDIRYEVLGPGGGTPLVMTHGFAGPLDHWLPELAPVAERRPLIVYDVRGHGRTTAPAEREAYSMPQFAADLAALLRRLGVGRAHVGGVSMGGMITAQFAVDYPEVCASVILCDTTCGNAAPGSAGPAADWERRMQMGLAALMHMAEKYGLEETLRREHEWKQANDPHLDVSPYSYEDDLRRIRLMTLEGYLGAAHAIMTRPDLTGRAGEITAPALIMIGEWDDFLPCALRDYGLIPNARLVVRRRCAHGSRWRHETFVAELLRFLDDVEAGRPVAGRYEV